MSCMNTWPQKVSTPAHRRVIGKCWDGWGRGGRVGDYLKTNGRGIDIFWNNRIFKSLITVGPRGPNCHSVWLVTISTYQKLS